MLWSISKEEHYKQLNQLLETMTTSGLTVKLPKCSFTVPQIIFGYIVSAQGIQPDNAKIEAVTNATAPKSASEVRFFLVLSNYYSRYIPNYSTRAFPLRQLMKEDATFRWTEEHATAFNTLKQALTSPPVLAHYHLEANTRVVIDASPWVVGAVLLQEQPDKSYHPIAYGSRSLTETEQKHAQIEKETLAIVFCCEHFYMYLYGRSFELGTDHHPLEHVCKPKVNGTG